MTSNTLPPRSLKSRIGDSDGPSLVGLLCSTPAPLTVELIAAAGFDFVVIDLEHTLIDDVLARDVEIAHLRVGGPYRVQTGGAYHISHHDFLSHPHPERKFVGVSQNADLHSPIPNCNISLVLCQGDMRSGV
ncbi:hypothetical protein BW21_4937 [Burkholderia humptydooensis]|uniref:hypothetical protein n=1 Tax=Burkholderia TaxID=32008 RepID=UPI0005D9C854|nr:MULTISPECIES: hypothetical protein [Burkholderia]AJY39975.1 hypothetical protein BW21_4937 [Burkholderia sp. 2002721687]